MGDWRPLVKEWLDEYASLQPSELKSFASEHEHNHEVAEAIYGMLSSSLDVDSPGSSSSSSAVEYGQEELHARQDIDFSSIFSEIFDLWAYGTFNIEIIHEVKLHRFHKILEEVCSQLASFYQSREVQLQRFTLQFLPTLVHTYLSTVSRGDKKTYRCIETLLIGIYNLEVMDENGKPKVVSFRLPSLAQASIYHEPLSLAPQFLTESALRRWEECNTRLVNWGPLSQVELLNAQNRCKVMTALFFVYNRQLSLLPKIALRHFCIAASKIVNQGFTPLSKVSQASRCGVQRIAVSSPLLLELVQGAYFAMFNEFYTLALAAVTDIDRRATYQLMPDVMLVTGAVINSLQNNPSGQPCDGPMGISVALSPATPTVTVSKSMITNASFRTKKLPDDIPIQAGMPIPSESADLLAAIIEETEAENNNVQRGGALRSSKPKLPSFPGLGKKTKDKEAKEKIVSLKNGTTVTDGGKKVPSLKDGSRANSKNSLVGMGDNLETASPSMQKKITNELVEDGSLNGEKMTDSLQNSMEGSDAHTLSQLTSDSLDLDMGAPRLAAMQVSSV